MYYRLSKGNDPDKWPFGKQGSSTDLAHEDFKTYLLHENEQRKKCQYSSSLGIGLSPGPAPTSLICTRLPSNTEVWSLFLYCIQVLVSNCAGNHPRSTWAGLTYQAFSLAGQGKWLSAAQCEGYYSSLPQRQSGEEGRLRTSPLTWALDTATGRHERTHFLQRCGLPLLMARSQQKLFSACWMEAGGLWLPSWSVRNTDTKKTEWAWTGSGSSVRREERIHSSSVSPL